MQTILGANGTIGTLLVKELPAYTDKIRLVSRNPVRVNESDELFPADLTNPSLVNKAVEGSDIVYLLIGLEYKLSVWQENWPKIMRSVINACILNKARLVFFDNVYMYDISEIPHMQETSKINPPSKKGEVRRDIADMLMDEVKKGKLNALIARSADFYGPGCKNSLLNELVLKNLKSGKKPMWFIDADKKHSFTFTPDAAKATAILGNTPDAYNQVWHLPTDRDILTGREICRLYAEALNSEKKGVFVLPVWMIRIIGHFIPFMKEMPEMLYQMDRDYFFDSSKFENKFNFKPTQYERGIRLSVEAEQKTTA
jgi:nucleoside-diphosphate-sugar epimerase